MGSKAPNIRILTVRDQKVVVDSDLAAVYGVTTKRLNEQFRRNRKRFPEDFAFQLTVEEFEALRSQIAILDEDTRKGAGSKRSQNTTTSRQRRRKTHRPWTFTEHGALQVANILRSDRAIAMSVYVIRAFVELRERVTTNTTILKRLAEKGVVGARHGSTRYLPETIATPCTSTGTSTPANRIFPVITQCAHTVTGAI